MWIEESKRSLTAPFLGILALAAVLGLMFNLLSPRGIPWQPEELTNPLWREMPLAEARQLQGGEVLFVDAREPELYREGRIQRAVNLYPREYELLVRLLRPQLEKAPRVVVYGNDYGYQPAAYVAQRLIREGFREVYVLGTSFENWRKAGYPVAQPRRGGKS